MTYFAEGCKLVSGQVAVLDNYCLSARLEVLSNSVVQLLETLGGRAFASLRLELAPLALQVHQRTYFELVKLLQVLFGSEVQGRLAKQRIR